MDRVISAVTDTEQLLNDSGVTRPATPAISSARVRVTQSAGKMAGWSLRIRAVTSSAVAAAPVASPVIQPATPRPAVADTTPSRAAVARRPQDRREPNRRQRAFARRRGRRRRSLVRRLSGSSSAG